jgi:predicted TIM-barrel fold metal-dependent hydrolase
MESKFRVNFPPDPNPRKPRLVAPPGSWDTHFHVFVPHLFPYSEARSYTPPAAPIEHFWELASVLGIERGVIVQPSAHGADTRVTVDAMEKSDGRLRGVIRADPELTALDVRHLHAAGVRGVRFSAVESLGDIFDEAQFRKVLSLVEPARWVTAFHLDEDSLVAMAETIRRVELPVVIDAWARVDPRSGLNQPAYRTLRDLLAERHVWLKITAPNRFLARGISYPDMIEMTQLLIAEAPDRVIWGTDWPHTDIFAANKMPNDGDLMDMLLDFAPEEAMRRKILVDNPKALFDFD